MPAQTLAKTTNGEVGSTLADILLNQGALSSEKARVLKLAEIQSGKPQEEIISEQNLVSEVQLVMAKALLYSVPYIDLNTVPVEPAALAILPQEVAERFNIFPIAINKVTKELTLAMGNPLDL